MFCIIKCGSASKSLNLGLNIPIPANYHDNYDFIIDAGHLEHCFNTVEYMKSIVNLLKVGGTIIHFNPTQGNSNHGFYCFQPTFYYSFYQTNGFEDFDCYFFENLNESGNLTNQTRVIPIRNFNNLDYCPAYSNAYIFFKAIKKDKKDFKIPQIEFYYRINKEKEKRGVDRLPDEIYRSILGDVPENNYDQLLKKSFIL